MTPKMPESKKIAIVEQNHRCDRGTKSSIYSSENLDNEREVTVSNVCLSSSAESSKELTRAARHPESWGEVQFSSFPRPQ